MASRPANLNYQALGNGEIRLTITGPDQNGHDTETSVIMDARLMVINVCKAAGLPAPWKD